MKYIPTLILKDKESNILFEAMKVYKKHIEEVLQNKEPIKQWQAANFGYLRKIESMLKVFEQIKSAECSTISEASVYQEGDLMNPQEWAIMIKESLKTELSQVSMNVKYGSFRDKLIHYLRSNQLEIEINGTQLLITNSKPKPEGTQE